MATLAAAAIGGPSRFEAIRYRRDQRPVGNALSEDTTPSELGIGVRSSEVPGQAGERYDVASVTVRPRVSKVVPGSKPSA